MRALKLHLGVYGLYLLLALLVTWPLATVFSTRLIGHPFGDSYEYIALIWWLKHALQTGGSLLHHPLLAYPDGLSVAFLWGVPLQSWPVVLLAFLLPLPAAFNLAALLTLALNGWSAFFLVAHLTANRAAAWVSGVVFLAFPAFQGHLAAGHLGLLHVWPVPLYIHALLRLVGGGGRRWIAYAALYIVLGVLGSSLHLIYLLFPITAGFLGLLLLHRQWRGFGRVLLSVMLGCAAALIFLIPVALSALSTPAGQRERDDVAFSADLLALVSPSFQHPLFTRLDYPHRVLGIDPFEKLAYVGIAAGLLALLALWRRPAARGWLLLGLVAWMLSLGPILKILDSPLQLSLDGYDTYVALPWSLARYVPLLNISRTPARFNFTLALVVAVLAGYGMGVLWESVAALRIRPHRWRLVSGLLVVGLTAFTLYEYTFFWSNGTPDMPTIPGTVPEPIAALASRDDIRAVFDIPWDHLLVDKEAMFLQIGHQRPIIAGHITRRTPVDPAKLSLLQTLDPALLDAAGVDVVVLHKEWDDDAGQLDTYARARLGQPFYEDERYALFAAPQAAALPDFTTLPYAGDAVTNQAASYLYTPAPGWTLLSLVLRAGGREVSLLLDGDRVHRWRVDGEIETQVPLYLPTPGYHTISLALDPPCPALASPALACRSVAVSKWEFDGLQPRESSLPVDFAHGVTLAASAVSHQDTRVTLWLLWRFNQPRAENEVRFVHVVDVDGNVVAQLDEPLGAHPAGSQWSEAVTIPLPPDLPPGEYRVYTGWYAYPDTTPFPLLSDVPDASAGRLQVGAFTVP